jgi:hypothetical protein
MANAERAVFCMRLMSKGPGMTVFGGAVTPKVGGNPPMDLGS